MGRPSLPPFGRVQIERVCSCCRRWFGSVSIRDVLRNGKIDLEGFIRKSIACYVQVKQVFIRIHIFRWAPPIPWRMHRIARCTRAW